MSFKKVKDDELVAYAKLDALRESGVPLRGYAAEQKDGILGLSFFYSASSPKKKEKKFFLGDHVSIEYKNGKEERGNVVSIMFIGQDQTQVCEVNGKHFFSYELKLVVEKDNFEVNDRVWIIPEQCYGEVVNVFTRRGEKCVEVSFVDEDEFLRSKTYLEKALKHYDREKADKNNKGDGDFKFEVGEIVYVKSDNIHVKIKKRRGGIAFDYVNAYEVEHLNEVGVKRCAVYNESVLAEQKHIRETKEDA